MGWVESPPYFCAVTETIADIANRNMHHQAPPHRLDELADTPPPTDDVPLPAESSLPTVTKPLVTQPSWGPAKATSASARVCGASCCTPSTAFWLHWTPNYIPNTTNPLPSRNFGRAMPTGPPPKLCLGGLSTPLPTRSAFHPTASNDCTTSSSPYGARNEQVSRFGTAS
jgi:hypothetical protein